MMTISVWVFILVTIGAAILSAGTVLFFVADKLEDLVNRELALDKRFLVTLRELYRDPDHDIDGGDLVQAVGLWATGHKWLAFADLEAMLPSFEEGRS